MQWMKIAVPAMLFLAMCCFCNAQVLVKDGSIGMSRIDPTTPQENVATKIAPFTYIIHLSRACGSGFIFLRLGVTLWDNYYQVVLYNSEGREKSRGQLRCPYDYVPVALIELKTDSKALPDELRNTWINGVVVSKNSTIAYSGVSQMKLSPFGGTYVDSPLIVTPVRWDRYENDDCWEKLFSDAKATFEYK